jgi:hypothetical protein
MFTARPVAGCLLICHRIKSCGHNGAIELSKIGNLPVFPFRTRLSTHSSRACGAFAVVEFQQADGAIHGCTVGTGTVIAMTFPIFMEMTRARIRASSMDRSCGASPGKKASSNYRSSKTGVPPRFRLSGLTADTVTVQTRREGDARQDFRLANRGTYWESVEQIPEPQFAVSVIINQGGHAWRYETQFTEHDHGHHEHGHDYGHGHDHETAPEDDPLYAPLRGETAVLTRRLHAHRHGRGSVHSHWHDHTPASSHSITADIETEPPAHDHRHKTTARTALLLILGSSPMVEGIPAFFAAGKYGVGKNMRSAGAALFFVVIYAKR